MEIMSFLSVSLLLAVSIGFGFTNILLLSILKVLTSYLKKGGAEYGR